MPPRHSRSYMVNRRSAPSGGGRTCRGRPEARARHVAPFRRGWNSGLACAVAPVFAENAVPDADPRRRLAIWHALSDLFRDAPITAADRESLARRLNAVGCGAREGQAVLTDEVSPVFFRNFDKSAGAPGWTQAEVRWQVEEFLAKPALLRWLGRLQARRARVLYEPNWRQVAARLAP